MAQARRQTTGKGRSGASATAKNPVPLYKRSRSHFDPNERKRGAELFRSEAVALALDGTRGRAAVEDDNSGPYRVGLDWSRISNRRLHCFCECSRFHRGKLCSHIWAALLAHAESGVENQLPGKDRLGLRKDRATVWQDLLSQSTEDSGLAVAPTAARRVRAIRGRGAAAGARTSPTSWRSQVASIRDDSRQQPGLLSAASSVTPLPPLAFRFYINTAASMRSGGLVMDVFGQKQSASGALGKPRRVGIDPERLEELLLPPGSGANGHGRNGTSLAFITEISGSTVKGKGRRGRAGSPRGIRRLILPRRLYDTVLPYLCAKGSLGWWDGHTQSKLYPLSWDAGASWRLVLQLEMKPAGSARMKGTLARNGDVVPLSEPRLILAGRKSPSGVPGPALVVFAETIGRLSLDPQRDLPWLKLLRSTGGMVIPKSDVEDALMELMELPTLPELDLPSELDLEIQGDAPSPRLQLEPSAASSRISSPLLAELSFDYGDLTVAAQDTRSSIVDWEARTLVRRDLDTEHAALVRLLELGVRGVESPQGHVHALEVRQQELPAVIEPLLREGWTVQVEGRSVSPPSPPALRVESGIDWFDLSGQVEFGGDQLDLTEILAAVSRGDRFIELNDGSRGLLPEAWMETYGSLAELAGSTTDDGLRFQPSQALIVDALLTAMPPADVDAEFARLRERLESFSRIRPKKEPRGFGGTLRSYQRDGLGWLSFLREFGLGGVLADDMGLGKTVQVLALIQAYRARGKSSGLPFLVVAPRSVVYNWIDEASRFTPNLKAVEYRGIEREALQEKIGEFDIVVTTYATLRMDIGFLATVEFDTVILDEAQAIKNAASQTAKASRLVVARHRLALTGTPIENHLRELGSIFEFLNPGMLGRLPRLEVLNGSRAPSQKELEAVAADIRPFVLRRTKAQVLPDLPPRTEQVLLTELLEPQRELYDQLRATYHDKLLEQVEQKGVAGSAIQVLEALLRLRQVACHPGLVNPDWEEAGSAKLETLFEQVEEVLDEGHKALVFSQFTTLLSYVRKRLDAEGVPYAYLDGQTRNRDEVVERFQTDPECNLFLISLKAGGVGLNLTAAGYVFLLDPWWNPAVEAQAIDRAHRIGQTQPVFAYKMIAQDTVEEKLLELQAAKTKLADAILEGEGQSLKDLTAEDLKMLLS